MLDSVHQKHGNSDQLAEDFQVAFRGCELADVAFIVGDSHMPLYAVKAILACRSRSVETHKYMYMYMNKSLQEICWEIQGHIMYMYMYVLSTGVWKGFSIHVHVYTCHTSMECFVYVTICGCHSQTYH